MHTLKSRYLTLTDADTAGGITLTQSVNGYQELQFGSCVPSKIEFTVLDLKMKMGNLNIEGMEFEYSTPAPSALKFQDDTMLILQDGMRYEFFSGDIASRGFFTAEKPVKINDTKYKITCYDRLRRFDIVIDDWYNALEFPMTLKQLLVKLCEKCDVELGFDGFTNDGFIINKNVKISNTKAKVVLTWILEAAGYYAAVDEQGKLIFGFFDAPPRAAYTFSDNSVIEFDDGSAYEFYSGDKLPDYVYSDSIFDTRISDFSTSKVERLQIKARENDIGVIVGNVTETSNAYVIENNPLLYANSADNLTPIANSLLQKLKDLDYVPIEVCVESAADFSAGSLLNVVTRSGTYPTFIFSKTVNALKTTYTSTGSKDRKKVTAVNWSIQQLRGKTNEIVNTIDEFSVTLTEVESETKTNAAQIAVQAKEIALKVSSSDYNGEKVVSMINVLPSSIKISAKNIDISGFVTFSNLTDGTTTISGSNIKTGSINADGSTLKIGGAIDLGSGGSVGGWYVSPNTIQNSKDYPTITLQGGGAAFIRCTGQNTVMNINSGGIEILAQIGLGNYFRMQHSIDYYSQSPFYGMSTVILARTAQLNMAIGCDANGANAPIKIATISGVNAVYMTTLQGSGDTVKIDSTGRLYKGSGGGSGGVGISGTWVLKDLYWDSGLEMVFRNGLLIETITRY